jgi:tRNA-Thr(GGU) m(6)t(6)A37 methyltransferase TsaA
MPPLGVAAAVEIYPEYQEALLQIDKHTHLWVLAWLDQTGREALQVTPRGVRDQGEKGLHGVFAVRSPTRPNPIGLTAARIVARRDLRIELDRLDFSDGTAVVDLKPYLATRDLIYSASNAQIGKPASAQAVGDSLLMQAEAFCGAADDEVRRAVEIMMRFRTEVLDFGDAAVWHITAPAKRPRMASALMGMTRGRLGEQIFFHEEDSVVFLHQGERHRYAV